MRRARHINRDGSMRTRGVVCRLRVVLARLGAGAHLNTLQQNVVLLCLCMGVRLVPAFPHETDVGPAE